MRCIIAFAAIASIAVLAHAENPKSPSLSADEVKEGFVTLIGENSLDSWVGDVKHYPVKDGVATCRGACIYTKKDYANFVLRFEFKLPPAGNNGIAIRAATQGTTGYAGQEIQILDDGHERYRTVEKIKPYQAHGSIYGVVAAKRGFLKPTGEWNVEEIVADGPHIKVTLNGTVITEADISKINDTNAADHQKHPNLHTPKGRIGLLGHGDPVAFRNMRVKELPEAKNK